MKMTKHAIVRCQQRGINVELVDIIIRNGQKKRLPGGAFGYLFRKKDKERLIREIKRYLKALDKLAGVEAVESPDGMILTVYHRR